MSSYTIGQMNQLGDALERAKWAAEDVTRLGQSDKLREIKMFLRGELTLVEPEQSPLLRFLQTVSLPATERFVVADHFKVGKIDGVKIGWIGPNFNQYLLGKVEEATGAIALRVHELARASLDPPIITALGGECHETTLAQVWSLLKLQPRGEAGSLLTSGAANIFYVRDTRGVLCSVFAYWSAYDGDWSVGAYSVECPHGWGAGFRVFSR